MRSVFHCKAACIAVLVLMICTSVLSFTGCSLIPFSSGEDVKEIPSYENSTEYYTKKWAVRFAKSQIPDKGPKKTLEIHKAEAEEMYIVYKGKILCDGKVFSFSIDSVSGNIVTWKVTEADRTNEDH